MYSSLLSVHFWSLRFVAFFRTNWSTQPALLPSNKSIENLNASNLPCCDFFVAPFFLFFFEQGSVFPELFTGSGGIEFQITLRFVASQFLSAANPHHVCSSSVAERQTVLLKRWTCTLDLGGCRPLCLAYPWVQLSCRIHFPVHRDFLGFLRLSPSMHHHRPWCGYRCLRPSWFWWMSDLAEPDRSAFSLLIPRQSNLHTAEPSYLD